MTAPSPEQTADPVAIAVSGVNLAPPSGGATGDAGATRLRFIDGMRAIAVVAVVAYHIGLPGFGGGFVGVDVFFVISGFLISGQIIAALEAQRFRFAEFYARRVLRILPPLFLVLLATLAAGLTGLLLPAEIQRLALSAAAAAGMVSNHYFANTGYFAAPAEAEPLLHTWSLAVEEQFYLAAPLVLAAMLVLLLRRGRDPLRPVSLIIAASIAVGFLASALLTLSDEDLAFFSMPTRAWEFSAGALLAYWTGRGWRLPPGWAGAATWLGVAMVLGTVAFLPANVAFPGFVAAVPVGGAVLILAGGVSRPGAAAGRLLASAPMVAVGAVSYGWYLWHWPLLFFARTAFPDRGSLAVDLAAVAAAFVAAVLMYFWLERPLARLRRSDRLPRHAARVVAAGVAASLAMVALNLVVAAAAGRASGDISAALAVATEGPPSGCGSVRGDHDLAAVRRNCLGGGAGPVRVIVWGDSHSVNVRSAAVAAAEALGAAEFTATFGACPPLVGWSIYESGNRRSDCDEQNAAASAIIAGQPQAGVVLAARWMAYNGAGWPRPSRQVLNLRPEGRPPPSGGYDASLAEVLDEMLARIATGRRVLLVGPLPEFLQEAPQCLLRLGTSSRWAETCATPRAIAELRRVDFLRAVAAVLPRYPGARVLDPFPLFCDADFCRPDRDGEILFRDSNHLNTAGARRFADRFAADLAWAAGGP